MKIETGKYYRTRCGRKAFVAAIVPGSPFVLRDDAQPVCGYIEDSVMRFWNLDGTYQHYDSPSPADLIAEWHEPRVRSLDLLMILPSHGGDPKLCTHNPGEPWHWDGTVIARQTITLTEGDGIAQGAAQ